MRLESSTPFNFMKSHPLLTGRVFFLGAFSLLELLVSVAIIAILLTLFFSLGSVFKVRASDAGCKSNLRVLHAGLSSYMQEHDMVWPQLPQSLIESDDADEDNDKEAKWWYETLKPYDVPKKTWLCPGDADRAKAIASDEIHLSTYSVTEFDDVPNTAYRYKQPWVIEDGDMHGRGKGPNMIFPDGSIQKGMSLMQPE
jgi:prepilin-type N-terminal cleavage/methylation domain-containing protein